MSPAGSVLWALLPLFTIGLGTFAVLGWAAWRLQQRALAVLSGIALAVTIVAVVMADAPADSVESTAAGGLIAVVLVGGGLGATFSVRRSLVGTPPVPDALPSAEAAANDAVLADTRSRRELRVHARELLAHDPGLARELRIGRPDLPRAYDDGGLADVNHVPAPVLETLPGMTPDLARQIVETRESRGSFTCIEELEVFAELPDELAVELADRLLFLN
ncbi:ComEA family DNA-binding protein [Streptacidiphilus fuscans]|uniref:Helix-hairpin-helix domain-containing protein n=1 Tax=Streptacidiphilus fuscans TaxID=2789292 RepID=A0A931B0I7_9ACTN|nr:helix-hairpin-helix domain-containing protein [Streptacidiphilus fuscans]MBF9068834.1 helix-hairpin-helix domain-containing protein [Streptacidiphilus fuscans]